jgi:hypothetical protein
LERLLSSDGNGKIGKLLLKLECAERMANEMLRTKHYLDDLEKFHPLTPEQARPPGFYSSALLPMIDHAIIVYCSAFNSSNRRHRGVGRFDATELFRGNPGREAWHQFLKAYRDQNIAHVTDTTHKVWYLTSEADRRLTSTGVRGTLQNHVQPGSEYWNPFRAHLEFTNQWFLQKAQEVRGEVERLLSAQPAKWFDTLPRPTDNVQIARSWQQFAELVDRFLETRNRS